MASAEHVKGLIRAHLEQDNARFKTIVLQIAANEARQGHMAVARDLKQLSEKLSNTNNIVQINNNPLLEIKRLKLIVYLKSLRIVINYKLMVCLIVAKFYWKGLLAQEKLLPLL